MEKSIQIQNAFNVEYTHMTRSLAVRLLQNIADNQKYSEDLVFFEISKIYEKSTDHVPRMQKLLEQIEKKPYVEKKILAGVCVWQSLESLRWTLEHYMRKTLWYIPPVHQGKTHLPFLHPGASGYYSLDDVHIISFGKIHPATASAYDISPETLYFEVNYEILLELMTDKEEVFHEISRYQTIERELNFILPEHTPTGDIAKQIDALHPWIQGVTVDSVFMDTEKVGTGKKSVNFAFTLSNTEWTISDEDALQVQNLIIEGMKSSGIALRGF